MSEGSFDLSQVYVHFGLGGRAEALPDFQWTTEYLRRYEEQHADDGDDGRLAMIGPQNTTWDSWERHPRGVWHTVDVHEPGTALFITPGRGTQHRPR